MDTINAVARRMQTVLGEFAEDASHRSGFTRRSSKLTGRRFAQALAFGWLSNPDATLEELAQTAAVAGVRISPQGLDQRFTEAAAQMMRTVLEGAAAIAVSGCPGNGLFSRFEGVHVLDSSVISLPAELEDTWAGCGGRTPGSGAAGLKLQVMLDLKTGLMHGPELCAGRVQDRASALQSAPLPAGSLRIADPGYFSLRRLLQMDTAGVYFISRLSIQTAVFNPASPAGPDGGRLDLAALLLAQTSDEIDLPVLAGSEARLPCRLTGVRAPEHVAALRRRRLRREAKREGLTPNKGRLATADWTLVITNSPKHLLSVSEALNLYRARWQIEMLFKLWKSYGKIATWRSRKPWRILCEVYTKLLVMLMRHWVLAASFWRYPDRSMFKASATIRRHAVTLAGAFAHTRRLVAALNDIQSSLAAGCRINRRRKRPATHQLLETSPPTGGAAMAALA